MTTIKDREVQHTFFSPNIFLLLVFWADLSEEWYDEGQEAAKERHKAVELDEHAEEGPAQQHRHYPPQEGRAALQPIPLGKEGERLVKAQTAGQAFTDTIVFSDRNSSA